MAARVVGVFPSLSCWLMRPSNSGFFWKTKMQPIFHFLQQHEEHSDPCCPTTRTYPDILPWVLSLPHDCHSWCWRQCEEQINLLCFLHMQGNCHFLKAVWQISHYANGRQCVEESILGHRLLWLQMAIFPPLYLQKLRRYRNTILLRLVHIKSVNPPVHNTWKDRESDLHSSHGRWDIIKA